MNQSLFDCTQLNGFQYSYQIKIVEFYGILILVDYLMPNSAYAYRLFVEKYFIGDILNKPKLIYLHTI